VLECFDKFFHSTGLSHLGGLLKLGVLLEKSVIEGGKFVLHIVLNDFLLAANYLIDLISKALFPSDYCFFKLFK
jgi:hypothetical protein